MVVDPSAARTPHPLLALCGRSPAACPPTQLAGPELDQYALSRDNFLRWLRDLLGVNQDHGSTGDLGFPNTVDLGRLTRNETDYRVLFCFDPRGDDFPWWLRRQTTPTLLLVPSVQGLSMATDNDHGPGAHVELVFLDSVLYLSGGVVRCSLMHSVEPPPASIKPAQPVQLRLAHGTSWEDIEVHYVDGETVRVRVAGREPRHFSPVDFGMASERNRKPTSSWRLLIALCESNGECSRIDLGLDSIERLRTRAKRLGDCLREVFGIAEPPIVVSARRQTAKALFRALPEVGNAVFIDVDKEMGAFHERRLVRL